MAATEPITDSFGTGSLRRELQLAGKDRLVGASASLAPLTWAEVCWALCALRICLVWDAGLITQGYLTWDLCAGQDAVCAWGRV